MSTYMHSIFCSILGYVRRMNICICCLTLVPIYATNKINVKSLVVTSIHTIKTNPLTNLHTRLTEYIISFLREGATKRDHMYKYIAIVGSTDNILP